MKLIIAGSRTITEFKILEECLQLCSITPDMVTEVVSGTARGVDKLGERWAKENGIPVKSFPADWDNEGKSAGYMRNLDMANYGDVLLSLWDGKSKGTLHMRKAMEDVLKPVFKCDIG